jgi:hypothetical protein
MEKGKIKENTFAILDKIAEMYENKELDDESLIQIMQVCGDYYLKMKTIADYAKDNNLTYQGVRKERISFTLFNSKFVKNNGNEKKKR